MITRTCVECNEEFPKNEIKRINKKWICVFCWRKNRDNKRDHLLHTIGGVRRKEDIIKEAKEKRKRIFQRVKRAVLPAIKSIKRKKWAPLGISLTLIERQLLFRKYCSNGLSHQDADKKVKERVKFLKDLVQRLREKRKSEEEINKIFKEEFAKLCEKG